MIASEKKYCEKTSYTYSVQSYTRLFTFLWAKLFFHFFSSKSLLDLFVHLFMVIASGKKNCEKKLYTYSVQSYTRLFTFLWAKLFFQFFSSKSLLDLFVHLCMVIASEKKNCEKIPIPTVCNFYTNFFMCLLANDKNARGDFNYKHSQNILHGMGNTRVPPKKISVQVKPLFEQGLCFPLGVRKTKTRKYFKN